MTDGTLLRGEVLARWQEYVGTGEFFKQVESTISKVRDRITAALKGQAPPSGDLGEALQTGVAALIDAQGQGAAATVARQWRQLPGGDRAARRGDPGCRRRPRTWGRAHRSGWSATGRARCSSWCAARARTVARRRASRHTGSTASA